MRSKLILMKKVMNNITICLELILVNLVTGKYVCLPFTGKYESEFNEFDKSE